MDKDLRKLSRKDLLEIILDQAKRIEAIEIELEQVRLELNERKASLKNVGSLAEASLVLSDIFKSADETVNIYIDNVKELARKEERMVRKELKELKKKKIEEIEKQCQKRLLDTEKEIKKLSKNNEVKDASKKRNKKSNKNVTTKKLKEEKVNE